MVNNARNESTILYLPDYQYSYDIKPLAFLAKNDFNIQIQEGQITSIISNEDSTAFFTFLSELAKKAAEMYGPTKKSEPTRTFEEKNVFSGTFGLEDGIYRLDDYGKFEKATP